MTENENLRISDVISRLEQIATSMEYKIKDVCDHVNAHETRIALIEKDLNDEKDAIKQAPVRRQAQTSLVYLYVAIVLGLTSNVAVWYEIIKMKH